MTPNEPGIVRPQTTVGDAGSARMTGMFHGVLLGLVAGGLLGWSLHTPPPVKAQAPVVIRVPVETPTPPSEPPTPTKTATPTSPATAGKVFGPPTPPQYAKGASATAVPKVSPLPPMGPLTGNLAPFDPNGTAISPTTEAGSPAEVRAAEARVRVIASRLGAKVVSVGDPKQPSPSVLLSVPVNRADDVMAGLRSELGDSVAVSRTDAPGLTPESPELRRQEAILTDSKKRLDKARHDFLPDAPILAEAERRYAEQSRKVEGLRSAGGRTVLVTVVFQK